MSAQQTRRRPRRSLLAGLVAVLLACLPAGCDEGTTGIDQASVTRCAQRAAAALAEHAGLALPELPPVLLLTAQEARARREAFVEGLVDDETGFTRAVDLMADQVLGDSMLGRYLPDEKVVYIIEDVLVKHSGGDPDEADAMLFGLLAHELVHAYDDQVHQVMPTPDDLLVFLEEPSGLSDIQTLMSLIEGRAAFASELACLGAGERPMDVPSEEDVRRARVMDGGGSVGGEVLAGLGNAVARVKLMQYAQGYRFSKRAWAYGGEAFFERVFASLPLSMEELEDFDAFWLRWAEELADADASDGADGGAAPSAEPGGGAQDQGP